jgi:hypothetical protein
VNQRPRFSLIALFKLTSAVSVLLGLSILCRNSPYFKSLWSISALATFAIVITVFVIGQLRLIAGGKLAAGSVFVYALSLCVPALKESYRAMWGWEAFFWSFAGIDFFEQWSRAREFRYVGGLFWNPIACTMGAVANTTFVAGYIVFVAGHRDCKARAVAFWLAVVSATMAVAVFVPLGLTLDLAAIYAGYGLWIASPLALAIGIRRMPEPLVTNPLAVALGARHTAG